VEGEWFLERKGFGKVKGWGRVSKRVVIEPENWAGEWLLSGRLLTVLNVQVKEWSC
jgi:hypothetical protein